LETPHVISIIDDDPSVREATQCLVRSLGYNAQAFSSAEEYLESGRWRDSACVITADGHQIPIIFITAYFEDQIRERAMHGGAFGFLRKPFDDESLAACLNEALGGPVTRQ